MHGAITVRQRGLVGDEIGFAKPLEAPKISAYAAVFVSERVATVPRRMTSLPFTAVERRLASVQIKNGAGKLR